jgi:hypothetical protein
MPKVSLNGFVEKVGNVQFVGANNTAKQSFILKVPGYTDSFGEKKGPDDFWEITVMGDSIDKFNLHSRHVGSKVKTEVYINSRMFVSKKEETLGKISYIVNVNLASIDFLEKASANQVNSAPADQPSGHRPGEDDDLPF